MIELPLWFLWGVPAGALLIAGVGLGWAYYASAQFDRKYGKRG